MNTQKGISTPLLIGIIAIVVILGAASLFGGDEEYVDLNESENQYINDAPAQNQKKISGSSSGVANYTKSAYDAANASGKVIIVFFDSPTCGEQCPREIPLMKAAFAKYSDRPIAGFIADINTEKTFANSLNVFAPSGKAVVINNAVKNFSNGSWGKFEYENAIEGFTDGPEDEF